MISTFLCPLKDDLGLNTVAMYGNPQECGQVYTGHTDQSIKIRVKEYYQHIRLGYPENWHDHHIQLLKTKILFTKPSYMDQLMECHPHNTNRKNDLIWSKSS
jgi:hypothetical protein